MMLRVFLVLLLVTLASSSFNRVPRLSDPLGLGLGWELHELQVEDYVKGSVWPKPQEEAQTGAVFKLAPQDFKFTITGQSCDVLEEAIERYKHLTFPDNMGMSKKNLSEVTQLAIKVIDKYEKLTLESDESCKYKVSSCQSLLYFNSRTVMLSLLIFVIFEFQIKLG